MKLKEKLIKNKNFKKSLVVIFIFVILGSFVLLLNNYQEDKMEEKNENLYQGPVPEGYDEDYFRRTGITKPITKPIEVKE